MCQILLGIMLRARAHSYTTIKIIYFHSVQNGCQNARKKVNFVKMYNKTLHNTSTLGFFSLYSILLILVHALRTFHDAL